MDLETLHNDYLDCASNKKKSADTVIFELHRERNLAWLLEDVNDRTLAALLYAFVAPRPRPREVIACLMPGKVVQFHFDRLVRPEVEKRLTDRTFNNRVGFGPDKAVERLMQDIREVNTGSVRIGGSHYINAYILPGILSAFARRHPRVKIDLVESSSAVLSQMLSRREVDITFNCNPQFMEGFERYPAFEDHILLAVPKSFKINAGLMDRCLCADDIANKRHLQPDCPCVTLDAFRSLEFILLNPGNNLRDRAKRLFEEAGFSPKVRLELSQLVTAYHLANAAMGAAFISDRLVVHSDDSLYYYKLDSGLTDRMFYMLLPNRKYTSKAVRAFVDCCAHSL